jgi:hypothetical protein
MMAKKSEPTNVRAFLDDVRIGDLRRRSMIPKPFGTEQLIQLALSIFMLISAGLLYLQGQSAYHLNQVSQAPFMELARNTSSVCRLAFNQTAKTNALYNQTLAILKRVSGTGG